MGKLLACLDNKNNDDMSEIIDNIPLDSASTTPNHPCISTYKNSTPMIDNLSIKSISKSNKTKSSKKIVKKVSKKIVKPIKNGNNKNEVVYKRTNNKKKIISKNTNNRKLHQNVSIINKKKRNNKQ